MPKFSYKEELKKLLNIIKDLDRKVIFVFIGVAVLQTISWYYTSRKFFRLNFYYTVFQDNPNVDLIEYLYWFLGDFVSFFILPALIIIFLLREKISNYGVTFGDFKVGIRMTIISLIIMFPLIWFASSSSEFANQYPHLQAAKTNLNIFLIYEAGMFIYLFSWEFIWRGFMLFGLEEKFGYYAVLIQMIPFVILHNGKPDIETFSAILGGIALGFLAFRTRSFIYGVIIHFGIMFGIDFISSLRYKADDFGNGLESLINVFTKML